MRLMPGTTLHDLDKTDIDTLLPWYLWKVSDGGEGGNGIVYRDGRPFRVVKAKDAKWTESIF